MGSWLGARAVGDETPVSWRVPAVEADDLEDSEQAAAAQELAELLLVDVGEAAAAYGFPIEGGRDVLGAMIGAIAIGGAVRVLDSTDPAGAHAEGRRLLPWSVLLGPQFHSSASLTVGSPYDRAAHEARRILIEGASMRFLTSRQARTEAGARAFVAAVVAVVLSLSATAASAETTTSTQWTAAADTFVRADMPTKSFGTSRYLCADGSPVKRTYFLHIRLSAVDA
jgi:hypothetical protein